jgi:heme-degrading monooxygenase HmoA
MFVILWEFEVKPGSEPGFERVYGPGGAWTTLFERDPHYCGTKLLRDVSRPSHFYTVDYWNSESDYRQFRARHKSAYEELDRSTEEFTLQERRVLSCETDQTASP